MKKIYTFTLKSNGREPLEYNNNLRLLAHMLYESIYNYYGDGKIPLDLSESIVLNKIIENRANHSYMLESEVKEDNDNLCYEPFLIGDQTFGITISDESFDSQIIKALLEENLRLLKINALVEVKCFRYEEISLDDEINRENTIQKIHSLFGYKPKRTRFLDIFKNGKKNKR